MLRRLVIALGLLLLGPQWAAAQEALPVAPMGSPAANDSVRAVLRQEGDPGTAPRNVTHWVFPEAAGAGQRIGEATVRLAAMGFVTAPSVDGDGLTADHTSAVAGEGFDALTGRLAREMEEIGWRYDGWETFVIRGEGVGT